MKLNAIGILCSDIAASLDFYRRLGVPFPEFTAAEGHYEAALDGGMRLMLDSHDIARSFIEDFTEPTGNDLITLAIECADPAAVDHAFESVTGTGAPAIRPPFDAFWGQRYATVADPDGNPVDLFAPLS
ncbi:MAG: glyoxalase [Acidimicrobiia bacterium]|nr:VOC family protein [Acidimicrobiia bacterium]NNF09140.1 glyoxalase [Acidimicrobiia bacterium]NNL70487.1 glyoxalase [Acidimicrobiia bacterium]